MKRKILFMVFIFLMLFSITIPSLATNDVKNEINKATDGFIDGAAKLGNDIKQGTNDITKSIEDNMNNMENSINTKSQNAENTISQGMNSMANNLNGNYTTQRTAATTVTDTDIMNTNLWTWVALAVAGIIIVGLVWYYASERDVNK